MIPLPSFLATPLRGIVGLLALVAIGAGGVFAWRYFANRAATNAINSVPEIAAGKVVIAARKQTVAQDKSALAGAVSDFNSAREAARADPNTPASTNACFDKGTTVVTKCAKLQTSFDSLVAAQDSQVTRLTEDAVRARRGKFLSITAAVGYEPFWKAPAIRAGVELNLSNNWSAIGTADIAAKIGPDSTMTRRSGFIGLNYRFGGRSP